MPTTTVRIDIATHRELTRLAEWLDATVGETVALAVKRLRQDRMGTELHNELTPEDRAWLDADLG